MKRWIHNYDSIDHIPIERRRGAIGVLAKEIEAASNAWCKIESRVGIPYFGWINSNLGGDHD